MSKSTTQGLNADPTTDESYTYHTEPAHVGGERYARCTDCDREILCRIGTDRLDHAPGCTNA